MKIKITATAERLRQSYINDAESERLAGATVDSFTTTKEAYVVRGYAGECDVEWHIRKEFATVVPDLDLTKPVQTRDGREVEIKFTTDGRACGIVNGDICQWMLDGRSCQGGQSWDLVQVLPKPEPQTEGWINIYEAGENIKYLFKNTREQADEHAGTLNRVACVKVIFRRGQGL